MNRIQLDLVDMTGFVEGLHEAFSNLAAESQQALGGSPMKWEYVGNTSRASIPAYICNVADHASKVMLQKSAKAIHFWTKDQNRWLFVC